MSCCCSPSPTFRPPPLRRLSHPRPKPRTPSPSTLFRRPKPSSSAVAALSDPFVLEIAEKLEDSLSSSPRPLPRFQTLRDSSVQSLLSTPWPTRKSEPFRFIDISYLRKYPVIPTPTPTPPSFAVDSPFSTLLVIVDGVFAPPLSRFSSLPAGVFVGSATDVPSGPLYDRVAAALDHGNEFAEKDLFWDFNTLGAPDLTVIYVPAGAQIAEDPIHVQFAYSGGESLRGAESMAMSNPRVLVLAEEGAEVAIVEEHFGVEGSEERCYWANPVMEIVIEEGARVSHSYVQRQPYKAAHIKWTVARQKASSTYELVEISTGGKLSRHNLHIQQLGPETKTELSTFHLLTQNKQIQDLHSRLVLDHPRGSSQQLHKSILCDNGHGIFDGYIKVNRFAQNTDAAQETRSLLLAPQALVHSKPNLQIIADDVKCKHGAAISSELNEDQLFYFRARGVDLATARNILVFSFGAEVMQRVPFKPIREKVISRVQELLTSSGLKVG